MGVARAIELGPGVGLGTAARPANSRLEHVPSYPLSLTANNNPVGVSSISSIDPSSISLRWSAGPRKES